MTKRPIFGVYDSHGSAEILVRRGGITNYHLIAYSFRNISAKNYQNRLMCIEVIAWNVIVIFFETQCSISTFISLDAHYVPDLACLARSAKLPTGLYILNYILSTQ